MFFKVKIAFWQPGSKPSFQWGFIMYGVVFSLQNT